MNIDYLFLILIGAMVGASSGYLGSFMVLKRMSLVGDALSHVALPGIAIALMFGVNPIFGALIALIMSTFGIWYLGEKSEVYPEALVGVFFTASLSIGLLLTPEPELLEALFGNIDKINKLDGAITFLGATLIFIATFIISKKLTLSVVSEDLARSQKINVSRLNLIYLLLVSLVVAMGVKFLGTLLTGAMVIIPAVTAKNVARNNKSFQMLSIVFGASSAVLGVILAKQLGYSSGPIIVLTSILIFLFSYIFKNK